MTQRRSSRSSLPISGVSPDHTVMRDDAFVCSEVRR